MMVCHMTTCDQFVCARYNTECAGHVTTCGTHSCALTCIFIATPLVAWSTRTCHLRWWVLCCLALFGASQVHVCNHVHTQLGDWRHWWFTVDFYVLSYSCSHLFSGMEVLALPCNWSKACKVVLLVQPSSAAAECVFSF